MVCIHIEKDYVAVTFRMDEFQGVFGARDEFEDLDES